jgi:hypothetical protein
MSLYLTVRRELHEWAKTFELFNAPGLAAMNATGCGAFAAGQVQPESSKLVSSQRLDGHGRNALQIGDATFCPERPQCHQPTIHWDNAQQNSATWGCGNRHRIVMSAFELPLWQL